MLAAQRPYGPDGETQIAFSHLAMGRRIFSLLPEDRYDHQPLQSRDGRLTLVADIRLDNRDELMPALGIQAHDGGQLCDAAILLAGLERWGEGALDRIVGDFAFALWDAPAQRLVLARDFLGHRPLHYHCGRGFFAFASMPRGLHAIPEVPYGPDEQAMAEYAVLLPRGQTRTFFKNIERVQPAHIVTVRRDGLSSRRYWIPQGPSARKRPITEHVEGLRYHLNQATRSSLRGIDGTIATQLSGGLDSSAVTATAAQQLAPSGGKVVAFTAVPRTAFEGPGRRDCVSDEGTLAAATAALYSNIEHVLIEGNNASPLDDLDRIFYFFERPAGGLSNFAWTQQIARAARERGLKIMLGGNLGNATLSYSGRQVLPEMLKSGRLVALIRHALKLISNSELRWHSALTATLEPLMPHWFWELTTRAYRHHRPDVLEYSAIRAEQMRQRELTALARQRHHDFSFQPWSDGFAMRCWILNCNDTGNARKGWLGGWNIDLRDPTSDRRLVEYCLSIPTEAFADGGVLRGLAKHALADRLPQVVLNERRRGYQAADWHKGLTCARADIAAELTRLEDCRPAAELLDIDRLKRLIDNWPTGGWETDEIIAPYRVALLSGIAVGHFLRKASGTN